MPERGKALHVIAPQGETQHTIDRPIPMVQSTIRLAAWIHVRAVDYSGGGDNYTVAAIKDPTGNAVFVALYLSSGSGVATAQLTGKSSAVSFLGTRTTPMTYDAWHEIEIGVTLGPAGKMEWKLDGTLIDSAAIAMPTTVVLQAMLGVRRTNGQTPTVELFVDDVSVMP